MVRILIAEDSETHARQLQSRLNGPGYKTTHAISGDEALTRLASESPDLVLVDYLLPDMDGLDLIETIRREFPRIPTILVTAQGSEDIAAEALQRGAVGYIPKRRVNTDLLRTVQKLLEASSARLLP